MPKKKTKTRAIARSSNASNTFYEADYIVTQEPIRDPYYQQLPQQVKDAIDRLSQEIHTKPGEVIPELEKLIEQYPKLPVLYNYLSIAYSKIGNNDKAEALIQECIQERPDYLFARLNYAEFCLGRKEYDKVAEIFDHKIDLQQLYPNRDRFHVSEVAGFMGIMGLYFCGIGKREMAQQYYEILRKVAPDQAATKMLMVELLPDLAGNWLKRFKWK